LRCLAWSLKISVETPAPNVVKLLQKQKLLNPVDNLAKILAGFFVFMARNGETLSPDDTMHVLRLLFEEMSAESVGFIYKKRVTDAERSEFDGLLSDEEFVRCFVDDNADFKSVDAMHEAEKICKKTIELPKTGFKTLKETVKSCKTFERVVNVFGKFCELMQCDLKAKEFKEALQGFGNFERR
jgi:hypothetical protein